MTAHVRATVVLSLLLSLGLCQGSEAPLLSPIAEGWAQTSVNAVIFRRNSVCTYGDQQVAAFYDPNAHVVLARRCLGTDDWEVHTTAYTGDVRDAHNSISIMIDGEGFLHMAWDHHDSPLTYCRSVEPNSLELTEPLPMTGLKEDHVTYPGFHRLPDGNLVFFYRDGSSGRGNLMVDYYDTATQTWSQRQDTLIDGEGRRNAYWQTCVDDQGAIHVSWVWRETYDVSTNHDLCYAKSTDGGVTWMKSNGEVYELPIRASNAEYAWRIPMRRDLINQTSMCADSLGRPYIAIYWSEPAPLPREASPEYESPQFRIVFFDGEQWQAQQVSHRTTPFSLGGGGTLRIPISRPQIVADAHDGGDKAYMIFRDEERDNRVSVAMCRDLSQGQWTIEDLTDFSVGQWEPTYDTELWRKHRALHLFVQHVGQGNGETTEDLAPQMVSILEWIPPEPNDSLR